MNELKKYFRLCAEMKFNSDPNVTPEQILADEMLTKDEEQIARKAIAKELNRLRSWSYPPTPKQNQKQS